MAKVADKYLLVHPWKIIEDGFHPDRGQVSESLFSLANEHQGVRGYFDEGFSGESLVGVYLNGIYEERFTEGMAYKGISNRLSYMVNTVNWLHTRLELDGETLDLAKSKFSAFRRELDFHSGELRREFVWETSSGKRLQLVFLRLLSMETKELACQQIRLTPLNFSGKVSLTLGMDFSVPHRMFGESFWDCVRNENGAILGVSKNIHHRLFAGMKVSAQGTQTPIAAEKFTGIRLEIAADEGQETVIGKSVILHTDRDNAQSLESAWERGKSLLKATTKTYPEILAQNQAYWGNFWAMSDITIDGDDDTQQGIRFCIFQMQQTYRGAIAGANIGAKGLTGEAYNGNAFWDTETYCLPFYLFSNPGAAKSLLDFRYKTLPQAQRRAKDLDCKGACYPIATIDGTESCTLWQHASLQFQPTTAVAYAIGHYVNVTGDTALLNAEGAEMLVQICRFLASRGQWSPKGKFGYYAVMGPDEFQMMVNNNAYTNYMAKRTFEFTLKVLDGMDLSAVGCSPAEVDEWRHMASEMFIPYDAETGLYEQHEGFFNLPHIDIDSIPVEDFPLYHHWSYDRIYRNDMIKQPDVLMFMFLYNQSFTRAEKQANYDYYEPRCIHESSLSPSVHSILAAELGRPQEAFDFFRFAARIDLDNYNRNAGEGIHTTSIAAAWMNVVYGFGGMRSDGDLLSFNPSIPAHWKGYSFQVTYRGSVIRVEVVQGGAVFRVTAGGPVTVKIAGQAREVDRDPDLDPDIGFHMDWIITETNQLSPQDIDRQGNKLLIGNGYFGYRGTLEEYTREQKTATIISGLYDQVGDQWREPINMPNGGFIQVICNGEPLHVLSSKVISHTQSLDMRSAIHQRKTTFETSNGTQITIHARRFASLVRQHLLCVEYTVSADRECVIDIRSGIDNEVWDINGPHLRDMTVSAYNGVLSVRAITHENAIPVAVSETTQFTNHYAAFTNGVKGLEKDLEESDSIREIHHIHLHGSLTIYKFATHVSGLDTPNPREASRILCQQAASLGFEALLAEHTTLWSQRWDDCDIQIDGDNDAQRALRFSMYHLLAIVPTHTEHASIPARGLSGQMYKGAIFWDTEIFMLPFFTHAFPALARSLLLYRYHTLDGARRKAREHGYRGAFYAWESQDTGDDACTLFAVTDVFTNRPMRTYFRDKQVHISADIPYAFWQYYTASGDASIWRDGGAEVVFECARFFLSYAYYNPDKRRYEILDVTGPDEYHERVHNNAFTNRLVAHTFDICLRVAESLRANSSDFYEQLVGALDFENDLALIADIAPNLFQPDSISSGDIIPQFDRYFTLEDLPLKTLLERKLQPYEYLGGGNGLATTTQIIKQADVVLMMFLFDECYPLETKSANWEFYEPRTEGGSSLSACSYSLIASKIGKVDWAYKYMMKTATIDLTGEGKQYVGTLYIGGTHPAANGGAWMSAVFGLCGIHWTGETITINPHLPTHWQKVNLPFTVRGQKMRITLSHNTITVKALNHLETPLSVSVGESVYPLSSGSEVNY